MTYIKRVKVVITTDSGGAFTGYTESVEGLLQRVQLTLPVSAPLANTSDFTITEEDSGVQLLAKTDVAAAFAAYPRAPTHDSAGAAALYAAAGQGVLTPFPILGRIKIVVAQGGDTKTGTLIFDLA